jgi:hypothetical protein
VQVSALTIAASPAPSSSSSQSPTAPSSSGLSTGAKIGIILGTVLGVLLIAALEIYFFCARKRRAAAQNTQSDGTKQGRFFLPEMEEPEMEEQDREHAARKLFAGGQWRAEADAGQKVGELQDAPNHTSAAPVELEARRPMKW